ncbi:AMP-binding protein, partial [Paenibacillus sp. SM 69]
VPIDPTFPEERIRYMLEDSEAKLLLTQGHLLERAPFAGHIVNLDDAGVYSEDDTNPELVNDAENAAYVIYTS